MGWDRAKKRHKGKEGDRRHLNRGEREERETAELALCRGVFSISRKIDRPLSDSFDKAENHFFPLSVNGLTCDGDRDRPGTLV